MSNHSPGIAEEIREKKIAEIQRHLQRMHSGAGHDSIVYLLQENERITKEKDHWRQMYKIAKEEWEQVKKERDRALAYPTVDAYEAACRALDKHRANTESLRSQLAGKDKVLEWYADDGNHVRNVYECSFAESDTGFYEESEMDTDRGEKARSILSQYAQSANGTE